MLFRGVYLYFAFEITFDLSLVSYIQVPYLGSFMRELHKLALTSKFSHATLLYKHEKPQTHFLKTTYRSRPSLQALQLPLRQRSRPQSAASPHPPYEASYNVGLAAPRMLFDRKDRGPPCNARIVLQVPELPPETQRE